MRRPDHRSTILCIDPDSTPSTKVVSYDYLLGSVMTRPSEDVKGKGVGVRDERAHKAVARRHPPLDVPSTHRDGPCLRTAPLAFTLRAPTNTMNRPRMRR